MDSAVLQQSSLPDGEFVEENLINSNLPDDFREQAVDSDSKLLRSSDTNSLSVHNDQYTALLKAYVDHSSSILNDKKKHKADMYKIAKRLLFWIPIVTCVIIFVCLYCLVTGKLTAIEVIPELITALGTVLGTFWVIPQMITSYLFNEKEEEYLKEIIGKIQDYDRDIRGKL